MLASEPALVTNSYNGRTVVSNDLSSMKGTEQYQTKLSSNSKMNDAIDYLQASVLTDI